VIAALLLIISGAILIAISAAAMRAEGFVLTLTDSSCPIGIYRIVHKSFARGDMVEACLPDAIAGYGRTRGYLAFGECADGVEPVIKIVGAVAADRVDLWPEEIRVNGLALPETATLQRDSSRREVRTLPRGSYQTRVNEVWLFGLHDARSWDSRYFGPIPRNNILGAMKPVFTLGRIGRVK
jgi:conjugative transfer signal peptidase TraF